MFDNLVLITDAIADDNNDLQDVSEPAAGKTRVIIPMQTASDNPRDWQISTVDNPAEHDNATILWRGALDFPSGEVLLSDSTVSVLDRTHLTSGPYSVLVALGKDERLWVYVSPASTGTATASIC